MGEEIIGKTGQGIGRTETSRQAGRSTSSTDTRARAGAGARAGARTGVTEKTKVADEKLLAVKNVSRETKEVEEKLPTPVKNAPRPVSISTSGEEEKPEKKPRKRTPKKKEPTFDTSQIDALFLGLTDYIASRPNMSHWKMTEKEVKSITEPLGNMIAKSEQLAKISEHSDAIALTLAVVTIFAPRIFISVQMSNEAKKMKKAGYNIKKEEVKENGTGSKEKETGSSSRTDVSKSKHSGNANSNREDLSFLGDAIPHF